MSLELQFRQFLIDLIVAWLSGRQQSGGAELTRETTLTVLPWGQTTQTPGGVRFTKKQANLLPRPGLETNIITVHGRRYVGALGDTRKRQPGRVTPSRGGGAFPSSYPYQPVISEAMATRLVMEQPGFVAGFTEKQRFSESLGAVETYHEVAFTFTDPIATLFRSNLHTPSGPPLGWVDFDSAYTDYPQERPYCCVCDHGYFYITSWPHWDNEADTVLEPPQSKTFSVSVSPLSISNVDGTDVTLLRGSLPLGSYSEVVTSELRPDQIYARKYFRQFRDTIYDSTGQPVKSDFQRTHYRVSLDESALVTSYFQRYDDISFRKVDQNERYGVERLTLFTNGAMAQDSSGSWQQTYELTGLAQVSIQVGAGTHYEYINEEGNPEEFDEPDRQGTVAIASPTEVSIAGGKRRGDPGPYESIARSFPFNPGPVGDEGLISLPELKAPLTEAQKRSLIPFYDGWPAVPTPESRAEVGRLNPYIYDWLANEFSPPAVAGRLANPTGPLGVESSWAGLTWTSLEYVTDCFKALDAEGVEHLYCVLITRDGSDFTVQVSVDNVLAWTGDLMAFFPGSTGTLSFLSGETWPVPGEVNLKPTYNFAHPEWPFRDVAFLPPFTARQRDPKHDKLGQQFTAAAADAPITLWIESYDTSA